MDCKLDDYDFPIGRTFRLAISETCGCPQCEAALAAAAMREHKPAYVESPELIRRVEQLTDHVKGLTAHLSQKQAPSRRTKDSGSPIDIDNG